MKKDKTDLSTSNILWQRHPLRKLMPMMLVFILFIAGILSLFWVTRSSTTPFFLQIAALSLPLILAEVIGVVVVYTALSTPIEETLSENEFTIRTIGSERTIPLNEIVYLETLSSGKKSRLRILTPGNLFGVEGIEVELLAKLLKRRGAASSLVPLKPPPLSVRERERWKRRQKKRPFYFPVSILELIGAPLVALAGFPWVGLLLTALFTFTLVCGLWQSRLIDWTYWRLGGSEEDIEPILNGMINLYTKYNTNHPAAWMLEQAFSGSGLISLSQAGYNNLHQALKSPMQNAVLTILQNLPRMGNAESLSIVSELARGKYSAACSPDVKEAAEKCLPLLKERIERGRMGAELLRPTEILTNTLLRPSSEEQTKAQELLHIPDENDE